MGPDTGTEQLAGTDTCTGMAHGKGTEQGKVSMQWYRYGQLLHM